MLEEKRYLVLLVDDDPMNLKRAQMMLGKEYDVAAIISGERAVEFVKKKTPDIILLDINMPGMDGFQTLEKIRETENGANIPVIFLTADNDAMTETKCFSVGAQDFVGKPFVAKVLSSRVKRILEIENYQKYLEDMVAAQVRKITSMQEQVILGIANLIESRDGSTGTHVKNTTNYVRLICSELRRKGMFEDILDARYEANTVRAAVLHDIGKIKVPDAVLQKPGKLTDEEYMQMKMHAAWGGDIVEEILGDLEERDYVDVAKVIARHHHERWDGNGYPDKLSGDAIPLCARIMAVADVFDALTARRCYKEPMRPFEKVFKIMNEGAGSQFDPQIIQVFNELAEEFITIADI